jgi:hypothetical protein
MVEYTQTLPKSQKCLSDSRVRNSFRERGALVTLEPPQQKLLSLEGGSPTTEYVFISTKQESSLPLGFFFLRNIL